jgi:hypothetical protein
LTRTVSIFDDDTGDPINLTGITFLKNPNGFTGSNWVLTDGLVTVTSTTPVTVPGYPVGNQLMSLSMNVTPNAAVASGDVIQIADVNGTVVGGNAVMIGYVLSYTPANGALVAQIGLFFQMEIRRMSEERHFDDYSSWYDWGGGGSPPFSDQPLIRASLGSGLTIIDVGYIQINIPALIMQQLRLRTYSIAMAMTDSINTRQVFIGELPILFGGILPLMPASTVSTTPVVFPPSSGGQSDNIPAGVP